jgi:hypothetical protein
MALVCYPELAYFFEELGFRRVRTFSSYENREARTLSGRRILVAASEPGRQAYQENNMTSKGYLEPTPEAGRAFSTRGISGSVVMLNLLRFRPVADYSATPDLAPASPITGEAAYRLYMEHTRPHLQKAGGRVLFFGRGGDFLIGPGEERWDAAMLVQQGSVASFLAFASNEEYLAGMGHRLAALEDSRLLPLVEEKV